MSWSLMLPDEHLVKAKQKTTANPKEITKIFFGCMNGCFWQLWFRGKCSANYARKNFDDDFNNLIKFFVQLQVNKKYK